jgi:hypothetical protein
MLIIGTTLQAERSHQCPLCLWAVELGDHVTAVAEDMLVPDQLVWAHEECGKLWLKHEHQWMFLPTDGWELLLGSQKCFTCDTVIQAGLRAYRIINAQWMRYDRICRLCWLKRQMG